MSLPEQSMVTTEESTEEKEKELPKKRAPRRNGARAKKVTAKIVLAQQEKISACLTNIYQDDNGAIPDMKKIIIKKNHALLTFFSIILGVTVLAAFLVWTKFFVFSPGFTAADTAVTFMWQGPEQVTAGSLVTYTIVYRNNSAVALQGARLNVYYPAGFVFVSSSLAASNIGHNEWLLKTILPHDTGSLKITGYSYGALNEQQSWRAQLYYRPDNFNSDLQKIAIFTTVINSAPFALSISGPDEATVNNEVEYVFTILPSNKLSESALLQLIPQFTSRFVLSSSTPALDKNGRWSTSLTAAISSTTSVSSEAITFKVRGVFTEDTTTSTRVTGALALLAGPVKQSYTIATAEITPELIQNSMNLAMAINGSVQTIDSHPGDRLAVTVRLKNSNNAEIKNATLKIIFDAPSVNRQSVLKWADLIDNNDGTVQGKQLTDTLRRGEITWTSKKIPALALLKPNQEVDVELVLPIKEVPDIAWEAVQETTTTVVAQLSFVNAAGAVESMATPPIIITLNAATAFENRDAVTADAQGREAHAVSWILNNSFHALKNIKITATVYGDVSWTAGAVAAGITAYDDKTKQVTWMITEMPESVDVLTASFTLALNKKNSTQSVLVSKPRIIAQDAVTSKQLELTGEEVFLLK